MRASGYTHTCVECVLAKLLGELHKVACHELDLILQTCILGVLARAANLEGIVVQTDDVHVRETCNFPCGATHATADIKDAHAGTKGHLRGEVVLVTGQGRDERFALVEAREVERLGPTVLVE